MLVDDVATEGSQIQMNIETTEDLFESGLKYIYYTEQRLLESLEAMEAETSHEEMAQAFADHRKQTEQHIERLEAVFESFGQSPETLEAMGLDGLIEEHEAFVETEPDQAVLDYFNSTAAQKIEHYEIAAYGNLIPLASELGMDEEADMLEANLREEQQTLDELSELTASFDMDAMTA